MYLLICLCCEKSITVQWASCFLSCFYYFLNQSSLQCKVTRVEAEATAELLVHKTNMPLKPVYEDIDPVLWKRKGFHLVLQYQQQWCNCVMWLAQRDSQVILSGNTAWDMCIQLLLLAALLQICSFLFLYFCILSLIFHGSLLLLHTKVLWYFCIC